MTGFFMIETPVMKELTFMSVSQLYPEWTVIFWKASISENILIILIIMRDA